jgi:Tol biopolymer transport system component
MKLWKTLLCVLIVCLLLSATIPMVSAPKPPDKPGGGKPPKDDPPADPVIAVVTPYHAAGNEIWVMNADGSNNVKVHSGDRVRDPSWSPDGSSIAFKDWSELWRVNVAVVDGEVQGSNPTLLLENILGGPEWSPAGQGSSMEDMILFTRDSLRDLEVIPATGGIPQSLYTAPEGHRVWNPAWSPAGDSIAFMEWDGDQYALKILYVGSGVTTVAEPFVGYSLDWARQRTQDEIAYGIKYKERNKWIFKLYTIDIESGNTKFLFKGENPTWSPDDKLLFEYGGLAVYDFDTEETEKIHKWGWFPDWCRRPPAP